MEIVRDKMAHHVKKIVTLLHVFLATVGAEFSRDFSATIQAVGFFTILFMTHVDLTWGPPVFKLLNYKNILR